MKETDGKPENRIAILLFAVYGFVMLMLLFVLSRDQYDLTRPYWELIRENHNFVPFYTVRSQLRCLFSGRPSLVRYAIVNLGGNTLLFVPLGFFLPLCFKRLRRLYKTLLAAAAVMTAVELAQLFTLRGYADIDDLMLNLLGTAIGYALFRLFFKRTE